MDVLLSDYSNYVFGIYLGPPYGKLFYIIFGVMIGLFIAWSIIMFREEVLNDRKEKSRSKVAYPNKRSHNRQR